MGQSRAVLERQLAAANAQLETFSGKLEHQGLAVAQQRTAPLWRALRARVRQIAARLRRVTEIETIDAERQQQSPEAESPDDED